MYSMLTDARRGAEKKRGHEYRFFSDVLNECM